MKPLKILLFSLLTLGIMVMCKTSDVYAKDLEYHTEGDYVIDSEGTKYCGFVDSSGPITPEEAVEILNQSNETTKINDLQNTSISSPIAPQASVPIISSHVQISSMNENYVGAEQKVSPDFKWNVSIQYTYSVSVSSSVTGSFSLGAKQIIFSVVDLETSLSITDQTTNSYSYTVIPVQVLKEGEIGAIYYKPYYVQAKGTYTEDYSYYRSFTARYPKLLSNETADGLYYMKVSSE